MEKTVSPKARLFRNVTAGLCRLVSTSIESTKPHAPTAVESGGSSTTPQVSRSSYTPRSATALFLRYGQPDGDEARFSVSFGTKIARCEGILGYTFKYKPLLAEALTPDGGEVYFLGRGHRCVTHVSSRLAIYGDALMRAYMARQWLRYPPAQATDSNRSWDLTNKDYLCNRSLASVAQKLKLSECIHTNQQSQGLPGAWAQAQTVEALAAAAYLDGGDRALVQVMKLIGYDRVFHGSDSVLSSLERQERKGEVNDLRDKVDQATREDHAVQSPPEDEEL
ncbi:ribonuclease III domain-containing protein [Apiospora marii]|uniref:ribonuclease III domain-containing protein n=1 Tax=Apiospora marii TaxID=335849 RepID=UPI00312E108D